MKDKKELLLRIRDAVRQEATKIDGFKNGAIRMTLQPIAEEADLWIDGIGDFEQFFNPITRTNEGYNDIPRYETCIPITPGGSFVIRWKDEETGEEMDVDTYAFSALKIAYLSRVVEKGKGMASSTMLDEPNLTEDNGFGKYPGALCVKVNRECAIPVSVRNRSYVENIPYLYVFVCVSGAKSEEDEQCAKASIDVIKEFFGEKFSFEYHYFG